MKATFFTILTITVLGLVLSVNAYAQEQGDYRSASIGVWSDASIWEVFDMGDWVAAASAPSGAETITVTGADTVDVDVAVSISGYLKLEESGHISMGDGSFEFVDGSTYEHAKDGGSVPVADWGEGSTFLLTGTEQDAPGNRNQNFHHVTFNTPDLGRNRDMGWSDVTIGGDVRVISTGANRWQLTSAAATDTASFAIMGNVIVEDGQFAVQGTGNAFTVFEVHHYGNIVVTGGNFSLARGSQGNGTGSTTWFLYEGDFTMSDAATQNSNPEPGQAKAVFARGGTQQLTFTDVTYAGGRLHYEVADTTTLEITEDFVANGQLVNRGEVTPLGELTFADGAVYEHARNGGDVPTAMWEEGSTALFTGITTDAPGNRGQDYHHLVLNTPDLEANRDLSLDGNTISGDVTVISTGIARWQLVGGSSGTVTIMGDVIVEDGQFATQGTGSQTEVVVDHYGDIVVTGGNFSVSRGSQGGEAGEGTTRWYLHEGDFSMTGAATQNSNPWRATFVFAADGAQHIVLEDVSYGGGGLPVTIAEGATLNMASYAVEGNGAFTIDAGGTLATTHPEGVDGNIQTTGDITISDLAGFAYTGTEAQVLGTLLPDSVGTLTFDNPEGVTVSDTLFTLSLAVEEGAVLTVDTTGALSAGGGFVHGTAVNHGELSTLTELEFGGSATYEHARDGGSVPTGNWTEGSTMLITGTVTGAPGNRNQSYHHLVFNTPDLGSNLNMGFNEVTIGGDITVISTGVARWYLTAAPATDTTTVTIMGDVMVQDGQFSVQGTGNALTTFIVHHHGNIEVTGGNFSIARGSQGGTGTTTWHLYEGDFSMSNARSQNSNQGNAKFVFQNDGVQHLMLGEDNQIDHLPVEVMGGTTLDMGLSELSGNDLFTLNAGATLATAHEDGIAGAVQTGGDVGLDTEANFTFNGTSAQVTSTLMPVTVNDLVIDNEAGVTLSQETTINGVLRLMAGEFDNTTPFTLGPTGSISFEGGSLTVPVSTEEVADLPAEFALFQNYPNPFNPSTVIRYDIRDNAHVTITVYDVMGRQVAELVNQGHQPGAYKVEWNANGLASGVYHYRIDAGDFSAVRSLILMK